MPSEFTQAVECEDRQKVLWEQAKTLLEKMETETDEARSAEHQSEFDKTMGEFRSLEAHKERYLREAEMARIVAENEERKRPRIDIAGDVPEGDEAAAKREYHAGFFEYLRSRGGEREEAKLEEIRERVSEYRALTTGTASSGGALVPEETSSQITHIMKHYSGMMQVINLNYTTTGVKVNMPTFNDTSHEGEWLAESATSTEGDPTFGNVEIDAHEFSTKFIHMPIALIEDSVVSAESLVVNAMGMRFGRGLNKAFTTGDGSGKPQGIIGAIGTNVTRTASATGLTFDDILNLRKSVDAAYWGMPGCRFMFHQDILIELQKIKDTDGQYLWNPGNVRAGEPATIYGYGYTINNHMDSTLAINKKTVIFGDFNAYYGRIVRGYTVQVLRELRAKFRQVVILGWTRADGNLLDTNAIKLLQQKSS